VSEVSGPGGAAATNSSPRIAGQRGHSGMSDIGWLLTTPTCSRCGNEDIHVPATAEGDYMIVCRSCRSSLGWWSDVRARLEREAAEVARALVQERLKDRTSSF
jgi:hypothetical protein